MIRVRLVILAYLVIVALLAVTDAKADCASMTMPPATEVAASIA